MKDLLYLLGSHINTREGRFVVRSKNIFRQYNNRVIDWLEDDPDHILMAYSDEQFDPYPDIQKVEVATGRDKTVKRGQMGIEYWMADDNGVPRIGTGQSDRGNKRRMIIMTPLGLC